MKCDCLSEPPVFTAIQPPNPSLIWHLLSDEKFQPAPDCEWSPFVSITDVGSPHHQLTSRALIATAIVAVLFLLCLLTTLVYRLKRRSRGCHKSKTSSSDAIMTCGDNVWTYNSMKTSPTGVIMYNGNSMAGSRIFSQATPATMRSYLEQAPLRHSASTTLRLHPNESSAAYHTVAPGYAEHYEEIPVRGTLPPSFHIPPPPISPANGRMSMRKPPPTCRPPPPPQQYSPESDGSLDREIQRIPVESPTFRKWEDEGRESGYGTAPSRQWRSPPGSGSRSDDRPNLMSTTGHSMTYV